MKKTLTVLAMAAVLVFSFSAVAMAKYAGYAYNTGTGGDVGYLSWSGAKALMTANGVDAALQNSPHGGYLANTNKCAVCHSAHRAASERTAAGVGAYWKLTPGGMSCVACHTPSGANPIPTSLVEWPSLYADGGPHNSFKCLGACHGSVHGGSSSTYGTMVAYNLTNAADPALAAAFAAGNTASINGNANSASVISNGGVHEDEYYATFGDAEFKTFTYPANDSYGGNQTLAVMKATATGYTCGQTGCHDSSQFAVNKNGYAELRDSDPSTSTVMAKAMTGHTTNYIRGCGGCHENRDSKCAGCHDAKGKATNSSAFPHANRGITIVSMDASGTAIDTAATSGNLWMMSGDATKRNAAGLPDPNGTMSKARTLIQGNAGFDGTTTAGTPGNIVDGVCLKCHYEGYTGSFVSHTKLDSAGKSVADFSRK